MIRGWCPSLFEPMQSGDGLLVRIKPRAGGIPAPLLRAVADAAERFGNATLNLTGRANLQVRGLSPATLARFTGSMLAHGAAEADPAAERRRNLLVSPLVDDDPAIAPCTGAVARAIEAALSRPGAPTRPPRGQPHDVSPDALPGKFGLLVDGGGVLGTLDARADITVRCTHAGCVLRLDGGALDVPVPPEQAADIVMALVHAFLDAAGLPGSTLRLRMREIVARHGEAALFAAASVPMPQRRETPPAPAVDPGAGAAQGGCPIVGAVAYPGTSRGAVAAAPAFGQLDARTLHALADLAERHGDGRLRLSPDRTLLIGGIAAADLATARDACHALGLIIDPADPRLRIVTCPGRPACTSGQVSTRIDAQHLAGLLGPAMPGPPGEIRALVHLSGCAKGCAHPQAAALTLVGTAHGYRIVSHGRASDPSPPPGAAAPEAARLVAALQPRAPAPSGAEATLTQAEACA